MAANNLPPAGSAGPGISKIDPMTLPGFGPTQQAEFDGTKYKVRYSKIDLSDAGSIAELEILETKALHNDGVFILNKDKFTFMDKYFIIIAYLELDR